MKSINLKNIKLSQMQIFITAAECGNFTSAAESLFVTQPMITKTIQHLERELNIILFVRNRGKLKLTPAGRELYNKFKNLLFQLEDSIETAHILQEGRHSKVTIGISSLCIANNDPGLKRLKQIRSNFDDITFHTESNNMTVLVDKLISGDMDAIVVSKHILPKLKGFNFKWIEIVSSCLAIFVPDSSPVYKMKNPTLKDFKNESFVAFSPEKDRDYVNLLDDICNKAGFSPKISCYIDNEMSFKINLMMDNGVVLADSLVPLDDEHIRKVELKDYPNGLVMVWNPLNCSDALNRIIKSI